MRSQRFLYLYVYVSLCAITADPADKLTEHNMVTYIFGVTVRQGLDWMIGFIALTHSTRN
jgi:hypothetical protein